MSPNPLTAKVTKSQRRVRKRFNINYLSLCALRNPWRSLRLKILFKQLQHQSYYFTSTFGAGVSATFT